MAAIRSSALTVLGASALFAVVACGGGDGEQKGDDSAREITGEEMARMVLSLTSFGPEYAGFAADAENSGVLTLDTASEDDFDPAAERADLMAFEFLTGHEAFYSGEPDPGGTFFLGSSVGIFQTADGAAQYLEDSLAEAPEEEGKTSEGVTLKELELFEVDVADQAAGARGISSVQRADGSTIEYWFAGVSFRRGRLLGNVSMYAIDATDLEKQRLEGKVKALAATLNERMASVLAAGATSPPGG